MIKAVTVALSLLLGASVWFFADKVNNAPYEGDLSSVHYVINQLAEGVNELTNKHSRLQTEMGRLTDRLIDDSYEEDYDHSVACPRSVQRSYHNYDKLVRDFALESAGGRILDTGNTNDHIIYDSAVSRVLHVLTSLLCRGCDGARAILQPNSLPGECWAFQGSRGEATIQLLGRVNVTGVSLEHIPPDIAPTGDISSAPRHFQLEGLDQVTAKRGHDFGTFEYDKEGRTIQYFDVTPNVIHSFNLVRLKILSNWGHPVYTCVYRVRVHGELAPGQGHIDDGGKGDAGFDL